MALHNINCPTCSAPLHVIPETGYIRCEYCGSLLSFDAEKISLRPEDVPRLTKKLIDLLFDGSQTEAHHASFDLQKIRHKDALPILIEAYTNVYNPEYEDRAELIMETLSNSIKNMNDPEAGEILISALDHENTSIQQLACFALEKINYAGALDKLLEKLKSHNSYVRSAAAGALGPLKAPQSFTPLMECLKDESFYVRMSAIQSLTELGDPRAIKKIIKTAKKSKLKNLVSPEKTIDVRLWAINAVGRLGSDSEIKVLIKLFREKNPEIKKEVMNAFLYLSKKCSEKGRKKIAKFRQSHGL